MRFTRREMLIKTAAAGLTAAGADSILEGSATAAAAKGVRYCMSVDLKKCDSHSGCVVCIETCHRFHNVPRITNPRRSICWIRKSDFKTVFKDHADGHANVTLYSLNTVIMCNHCADAPCVRVCPTGATWRRDDGIIMMDQHRCIGCRYCMAACPYGSRSFNFSDPRKHIESGRINPSYPLRTRGVVEKCDLCALRIDRKQVPLCVAACPAKAIAFGDLNDPDSDVRKSLRGKTTLRRKPELGTDPGIYYIL